MYTDFRPTTIQFINVGPLPYNLSNGGNCDPAYFTFSANFYGSDTVESLPGSIGWRISNYANSLEYQSYNNGNITWLLEISQLSVCAVNATRSNSLRYTSTAPIGASSVTFTDPITNSSVIITFSSGATTTTTTDAPGGGGSSSTSTNAFCAKITSVNDNKIEVDIDDCENALGGFNKTITICHGCNSNKLPSGFSEKTIAICDLQGKSVNYVFLVKNADAKSPKPSISLCECTCSKPTTTTTSSPPNCGTITKLCAENFGDYESYLAASLNGEWDIDSSCSSGGRPCYKKITGQGTFWMKYLPSSSGQLRWSISSSSNPSIALVLFANCPEGGWHAENSSTTLGKTAKGDCPIISGACSDKLCGTGFAATQPAGDGLWVRVTNTNKPLGLPSALHKGRPIYIKSGCYMWYAGESEGQYPGLLYDHWKITNSLPGSWVSDPIKLELRSYPTGAYGDLACPQNTGGNQWIYEAVTASGFINPDSAISGPCATTTLPPPPLNSCYDALCASGFSYAEANGFWTQMNETNYTSSLFAAVNPGSQTPWFHNGKCFYGKTTSGGNIYIWYAGEAAGGRSSTYDSGIYRHWKMTNCLPGSWTSAQDNLKMELVTARACPASAYACDWTNLLLCEGVTSKIGPDINGYDACAGFTTTTTTLPPCNNSLNGLSFPYPYTDGLGLWTIGGIFNNRQYWTKSNLVVFGTADGQSTRWAVCLGQPGNVSIIVQGSPIEKLGSCPQGSGWTIVSFS